MSMVLTPYLMLNGNAAEAIAFYERVLDAKVIFKQTFGDIPNLPEEIVQRTKRDQIAHAVLKIGDSQLLIADTESGEPLQPGNQVTVCITLTQAEQAKELFELLQEGGQIDQPFGETYFSPAYGSITDKFGVTFLVFTMWSKE